MSNIIAALEAERIKREIPDFGPGDTVVVEVKVKEGERERVQAYEGVVIAKKPRARCDHRQASRQRPPRQALLPARPRRQVGEDRGKGLIAAPRAIEANAE